jgi:hypothetical protein
MISDINSDYDQREKKMAYIFQAINKIQGKLHIFVTYNIHDSSGK